MLTAFAEIHPFTAGGQVDCGFVAGLYPSDRERCPEGLHIYPCGVALFYLNLDLTLQPS